MLNSYPHTCGQIQVGGFLGGGFTTSMTDTLAPVEHANWVLSAWNISPVLLNKSSVAQAS